MTDLPTVLIVDDAPENLAVLDEVLRTDYRVRVANSGVRALQILAAGPLPDLILLDVMMPDLDGYAVLGHLRANPASAEIPVIFVTAMASVEAEMRGLEVGAADYITKPFVPALVKARVHTQLELKQARDWLRDKNIWLENEVQRRMAENEVTKEVSIRALAYLAEIRDNETGDHIVRTQAYVRVLAEALRGSPGFAPVLTERYIHLLVQSAPLHDIGKVGIPDAILRKPGALTAAEWVVMKTHAELGSDAIERAEQDAAQPVAFLALAKEIARWHHERWDGSGYPDGLAGSAIPVSARIMALADVLDALTTQRVYKQALPFAVARDIIVAGRGHHFDPDVVDAFVTNFDAFDAIARRHGTWLPERKSAVA